MLTFSVDPAERDQWLDVERGVWGEFLRRQPGFVRRERWLDIDTDAVVIVIWWRRRELWKAISRDQVAEVDARMGEWFRSSTMREFAVFD